MDKGPIAPDVWPSEFSQIRGQYRQTRYGDNVIGNEFLFQFLFSIGAHGAHVILGDGSRETAGRRPGYRDRSDGAVREADTRIIEMKIHILFGMAVSCGGTRRLSTSRAGIKIVTTTEDLAALVREVGGDKVSVEALAKGYQDPHFVEPKPSFVLKLHMPIC